MYTDDRGAQIVLSLLKQFGIRKIVVSPGTTNVPISMSVQNDPDFEVYSVVDERSAAYFATGLAYESGEPVVISCTGATASRNYLSGLTEAYYRHLPVIALTSQHYNEDADELLPQVTDRSVSQNDVKKMSVLLPVVRDEISESEAVVKVNKALVSAISHGEGPVHINLPVSNMYSFSTHELPVAPKTSYYRGKDILPPLGKGLEGKKIGVFVGSHKEFSPSLNKSIEDFIKRYNTVIFTDHSSGYHGPNRIQISQISDLLQSPNRPDIVIDLGSVSGDYSSWWVYENIPIWRVSEDGVLHYRQGHFVDKLFDCPEDEFFHDMASLTNRQSEHEYYKLLKHEVDGITVPNLPLSNTYISQKLASSIPKNSNLHLAILNSFRNMNYFQLDKTVRSSCNVGGFGIDGPLSTTIGQSMCDTDRLYFALVGDLAFFYDMNSLGIRHISKNVRILLVNNNRGVEFRVNPDLEERFSDALDSLVSAHGHFGDAKAWAESMGFTYISARNKPEFDRQLPEFVSSIDDQQAPMLFEVFTTADDEKKALAAIRSANRPVAKSLEINNPKLIPRIKDQAKKALRRIKNGTTRKT